MAHSKVTHEGKEASIQPVPGSLCLAMWGSLKGGKGLYPGERTAPGKTSRVKQPWGPSLHRERPQRGSPRARAPRCRLGRRLPPSSASPRGAPCRAHPHPPTHGSQEPVPLPLPLQRGCSIQLWDEGVSCHRGTPSLCTAQPVLLPPHRDLTVTSSFTYVPREPELLLPNKGSHLHAPSDTFEFCQTPWGVGAT